MLHAYFIITFNLFILGLILCSLVLVQSYLCKMDTNQTKAELYDHLMQMCFIYFWIDTYYIFLQATKISASRSLNG